MKKWILYVCCHGLFLCLQGQTPIEHIRTGNEYYKEQRYDKALEFFSLATREEPGNFTALFNKANALYKLDKKEEALGLWAETVAGVKEKTLKAKAVYNQGVYLAKSEKLAESIEAFREALRNDPTDQEARENLQKAMLELKKKQPPPKKDNRQEKNKQQPPKPKQQPQMKKEEADQKLKLLEQKEKQVQQRVQSQKNTGSGSQTKDW